MTSGASQPPGVNKGLLALSWPLLVSLGLSLSLGFVDAVFLSRVSDQAAGGVGAVLPALGGIMVCFSSIAGAGSSICSQWMGGRRHDLLPITRSALIYFNLLFGALVCVALFFGHRVLPSVLGLPEGMADHAADYIRVIAFTHGLKAVQTAYAALLNSCGRTGWVLAEAVVTTVSNLLINFALRSSYLGDTQHEGVFAGGAATVALATTLAQALGLGLTLFAVHRVLRLEVRWRAPLSEVWARLRPVLRIGAPSAAEPLAYQLAQTCIMTFLVHLGEKALAARVYVLNFYIMSTVLWCVGLAMGAQILVAHRVGAQRFEEAHRVLWRALSLGFAGCFGLALVVWLGHSLLLQLFTQDAEIIALTEPLFLIGIAVETGRAANVIAGGALRSTGDARFTALVGASMMWGVGVVSAWVLGIGLQWGLTGVWLAMALDEVSRATVNVLRWNTGRWKAFGVMSKSAE